MADLSSGRLRSGRRIFTAARFMGVLAGLGLGNAVACADSSDVSYQVSGNAVAPAASPGDGVLTGSPIPGSPGSPTPPGDSTPVEASAPSAQASGSGAPPPSPPETPPPVQAPPEQAPSASSGEPQPGATETNFFGAGCRSDADCGANRRCEFPVDSEADAATSPALEAGGLDAGADAAVPETLVPRGHCVAR